MKKILSVLLAAVMLTAGFAMAISAANDSVTGKITFVSYDEKSVVDNDGNPVDVELPEKPVSVKPDEDTPIKAEELIGKLGDEHDEFKFYGAFDVELTPEAKKIVGDGSVKEMEITVTAAGIDASNTPTIVIYDNVTGEYKVVESTVNGNEITFKVDISTETLHYGIIYTGSATSPSTGVPAWAFVAVIVVAAAGAVFAGKKAFAK